MNAKRLNQSGFHIIETLIVVLVIGVVGFTAFRVLNKQKDETANNQTAESQTDNNAASGDVKWAFDEQRNEYKIVSGKAPECTDPFRFDHTPVDFSRVTSVIMPGAYRGFNYKPHGGFRADSSSDGKLEVRMPMDATLVSLTRYYEGEPAELQYILTFESDCGIAFRFDHLQTLAPAFQSIAETTPEPKLNDTRTDPNAPFNRTKFKAGDVVATAIGFPVMKNFGFDFGVYDYRQPNEISKNSEWAAIHNQYTSLEWFGVCWFDMLPGEDAAKAKELANTVVNTQKPNAGKISDYCSNAQYRTLDFNNGQPTDG